MYCCVSLNVISLNMLVSKYECKYVNMNMLDVEMCSVHTCSNIKVINGSPLRCVGVEL